MTQRLVAPDRSGSDQGFTLIEVVVALFLLAIIATAGLAFFLRGMQSTTDLQRRQSSIGVANGAMELARSVSARPMGSTGVTALANGRFADTVNAAWPASGSTDDLSMYKAIDLAATISSTPALPITRTTTDGGVPYTVTTLVGACFRSKTGVDQPCGRLSGVAAVPILAPPGFVKMARVVIVVTWSAIKDACGATRCSYRVSALVDPSTDTMWNTVTNPVAFDDAVTVPVGTSLVVNVLVNDQLGPVTSAPTSIVAPPVTGQGTATAEANGTITYTAPASASGRYTFTYRLKDAAGKLSNVATVTASVTPRALPDSATTGRNSTITIPVTANDLASPASVAVVSTPGKGTATASGKDIVYVADSAFVGTTSFTYSLTDGSGQVSAPVAVTVTMTAVAPALAADITFDIPATVAGSVTALDLLAKTGNVATSKITVVATAITGDALKIDNKTLNNEKTGTSLTFAQQGNILGTYTFTYYVKNSDGIATETKTATLRLIPVAVDDGPYVVKKYDGKRNGNEENNNAVQLNLGANDRPMNFGGTVTATAVPATPSCGSIPAKQDDLQNGILRYLPPPVAGTCTLQYSIRGTAANGSVVSNVATVTITVTD